MLLPTIAVYNYRNHIMFTKKTVVVMLEICMNSQAEGFKPQQISVHLLYTHERKDVGTYRVRDQKLGVFALGTSQIVTIHFLKNTKLLR